MRTDVAKILFKKVLAKKKWSNSDITVTNMCAPNIASQYIKQNFTELQKLHVDNFTVIVGGFSTFLSAVVRTTT